MSNHLQTESLAKKQIESFVERFDPPYDDLIYHAALPLLETYSNLII
ncbi:MAG: hypothetical protein AB4062_19000 [Crocosphaera sp.]